MFDLNFVKARIGRDYERLAPRCYRLVDLYNESAAVKAWLDSNKDTMGDKGYKDYLALYNGLMSNIFKLEDALDLFREKHFQSDENDLTDMLGGNKNV